MTDRAAPSNWMLALLACAQLIIALDATIVFVALPEISRALDFSAQRLQWVVSAYTVAFGGFLLLGGRATDLLGRRRMYVLGQSLYALASLAGGLAQSELPLILARAVQGLGGALLFPATLALIGNHFAEGPARNRALAIWSIASAFGLALGSALGGALTELFGWASIFLVNVPLAGAAALLALRLIPADTRRQRGRRFDLAGALTVTAGATLLVFALVQGPESGWDAPSVRFGLYLSVPLLLAFLAIEHYSRDPLMPLRLLGNRNLQVAMLLTAIFMSSYGVQYYFLAIYFQSVYGYSVLQTGLAFLPATLLCTLGIRVAERLLARHGARATLVAGLLLGALGLGLLAACLPLGRGFLALLPAIVILSIGQGMTWTAMWVSAASGVDPAEQGVASGMASMTQQIGGALGLALLVALANAQVRGADAASLLASQARGIEWVTALSALLALFGAALAGERFGNALAEIGTRTASERRTRLRADGDGYRLDGRKFYCTGALYAQRVPTLAVDDEGRQQLAFVPRDSAGLEIVDDWSGFGQRTTGSGSALFDRVAVAAEDVVSFQDAFERPTTVGPLAQILHAAIDAGIARGAFEDTLRFVRERARPWVDSGVDKASADPLTIHEIGRLAIRLHAAEALLERAGRVLDRATAEPDAESVAAASIAVAEARALSTEVALLAGSKLIELGGSRACLAELGLDRHWRNARVHTLHDPVRWKYHAVGDYYLNGRLPPRRGTL